MRRPRITVGRLIAAVAIVAIAFGAFELGRRYERQQVRRNALVAVEEAIIQMNAAPPPARR
jgi:hypothetical protein